MSAVSQPSMRTIPAEVAAIFDSYGEPTRTSLLGLRQIILATAAESGVGPITETLKWGQPAYLTTETRTGSTIRLAPTGPGSAHDYGMYFICHTNLVEQFRTLFGHTLAFEGNRAVVFRADDQQPIDELRECVAMALTYA